MLLLFKFFYVKNNNDNNDNYVYKIRYDYNNEENYIYFMQDNIIKTVKTNDDEKTINFSDQTNKIVIQLFNDLYKKSGINEFNIKDIEISEYQERILSAIISNSEDMITLEDDLEYSNFSEEIFSENSNYKIINSKMLINNNTKNEIINNIANYLNNIINKDFDNINETSKEINTDLTEFLGVNLKLELIYVGSNKISFVYKQEGQLGPSAIANIKGYTFNLNNGSIIDFPREYKEEYYKSVLNNFINTEIYNNEKDNLKSNWKDILYDNIFSSGNWYIDGENVIFLIPTDLLGFSNASPDIIDINVLISDNMEI